MATNLKQHIDTVSDNPLDAKLTERPLKAYLVANLAFNDGVEASAEHYRISLGAVYAAMSFYEDNREAIRQALDEAHQELLDMGMIDGQDAIARIKKRMKMKQNDSSNSS
jgi:hypothetical protein